MLGESSAGHFHSYSTDEILLQTVKLVVAGHMVFLEHSVSEVLPMKWGVDRLVSIDFLEVVYS